ncbi:MAG: T9SS type A sorting domain-containing protein, partial [Bacteroidales bacterium]
TGYIEIKYIGDSLIDGKVCKVLEKKLYSYDYVTTISDTINLGLEFTYSDSNKVYYYRFDQFFVLYNFNAQPGDWWEIAGWSIPGSCDSIGKIEVDSIGTIVINSDTLKYLKISRKVTSDWQFGSIIVEKIGCIDHYMFPEPFMCALDMNEGGPFRCYFDNTFGLYQSGIASACDYITSIDYLDYPDNNLIIYPNPVKNILNINWDDKINRQLNIKIFNLTGQLVLETNIEKDNKNQYIDLSTLPSNIYLIKLTDIHGNYWIKKIIVN